MPDLWHRRTATAVTSFAGAWQQQHLAALHGQALTQTERDILQLVAAGHSDPDIARTLGLTIGPVKWALRELRAKLGARDRANAVHKAWQAGLLGGAP